MLGPIDIMGGVPSSPEARQRSAEAHEGELECKVTKASRAAQAAEGGTPPHAGG